MHLPVEMIRQPPIVVQSTQIRTAHVTDLQLLMPAGARGVGQGFELALFFFFAGLGGADLVELGVCGVDGAGFAQDADFEEAGVDGAGEVGDLFELKVSAWCQFCSVSPIDGASRRLTRALVCRISSGVFSKRRCAASILRLHSSMYFCMSRM